MSRLYDTIEPSVIDDEMLQRAVVEQGPKNEAGKLAREEGIDFADVTSLRLDFKNILKIGNLWSFKSLVKLQLDNNIIERIEGLDTLVNLVWLDLSFNNIEVIENLDNLTLLEDLTLYNNRIERVENMDNLTKLHVLSVGNNQLKDLENMKYLRKFDNLRTLNLTGNPIKNDAAYESYIAAHLPDLEYLDYRLVDQKTREAAKEKYDIALQELEEGERNAARKKEEEIKKTEELELHKAAYVEHLNDSTLFDSLYAEDPEGMKLNKIPTVDEMISNYREEFNEICREIFEFGLKMHVERQAEVKMFWECVREAKETNKQLGINKIEEFMEYRKRVLPELLIEPGENHEEQEAHEEYQKTIDKLWDALMIYEMQLVDQLEDVIKEFERAMSDMVANFKENVSALFSRMRELENQHNEKLLEIGQMTLEKIVKGEVDDDIPDEIRDLFVDKDTLNSAVTSSHDVHLMKIDNREDDCTTKVNTWLTNLTRTIHEQEEIERNRQRVTEISHLIDHLKDDFENNYSAEF
ncbi:DgyrCDS5252 [Dimorphilus gyrociliatus]|uniref:Dynein regulatory complex subunit 3 n=1 Tax=Dimorphilus gyrociliatus TaxID=2664684 RepID=A0A7I8VJZ4_9ANNE|nr:DgyrCDS5252 [Dimorphilus gyrociliatus]